MKIVLIVKNNKLNIDFKFQIFLEGLKFIKSKKNK